MALRKGVTVPKRFIQKGRIQDFQIEGGGGAYIPREKRGSPWRAESRACLKALEAIIIYRVSQLKRNTFQWFIALRLEGEYLCIWYG